MSDRFYRTREDAEKAAAEREALLAVAKAARFVLDGLHQRIDEADPKSVPVFAGIADLAGALNRLDRLNP